MGLDSVEIVIRTEQTFGIALTDAEATSVTTPRMLADLVATKLSLQASHCLLRRNYLALRRVLLERGVPARAVRPSTPLESLFPEPDRAKDWRAASDATGLARFPRLRRPLLAPGKPVFRRGCETVRDLATHLATWDPSVPSAPSGPWTKETVLLKVRQIVEEELGLHAFRNDDDFVKDLGMD
jgi:acyl carrier protein